MSIRKQVYDLTLEDLKFSSVWEFTHGAADDDELQDEATVRPVAESVSLDMQKVMCVAAARFALADGTTMYGFLSPSAPEDTELGHIQPTIIIDQRHVSFWFGIVEPTQEIIEEAYRTLGKRPGHVFPISFSLTVPTRSPLNGSIPGFLSLDGPDFAAIRVSY